MENIITTIFILSRKYVLAAAILVACCFVGGIVLLLYSFAKNTFLLAGLALATMLFFTFKKIIRLFYTIGFFLCKF